MKRTVIFLWLGTLAMLQLSCSGVKNVSGSLKKSDPGDTRDYSRSGTTDYGKPVSKVERDTISSRPILAAAPPAAAQPKNQQAVGGDGYRRDYDRAAGLPSSGAQAPGVVALNQDGKDRLLNQYAEMDRLADLVVYEINIIERRWEQLLDKFKTASKTEREKLSADLDQLSADQLKLYKAHVKIYKEGKTDWEKIKKDVEAILLTVRGINGK